MKAKDLIKLIQDTCHEDDEIFICDTGILNDSNSKEFNPDIALNQVEYNVKLRDNEQNEVPIEKCFHIW